MGANMTIVLPGDVRINDVATAMGILAGLPKEQYPLPGGSWYCKCIGVEIEALPTLPEAPKITLKGNMVDKSVDHYTLYHFESEDFPGLRMLYPPSTAFWAGVGTGLCKFFGGKILYNDYRDRPSNSVWYDKIFDRPRISNSPKEKEPWVEFQKGLWDLEGISVEEMLEYNSLVAYPADPKVMVVPKKKAKKAKAVEVSRISEAELDAAINRVLGDMSDRG